MHVILVSNFHHVHVLADRGTQSKSATVQKEKNKRQEYLKLQYLSFGHMMALLHQKRQTSCVHTASGHRPILSHQSASNDLFVKEAVL